MESRFVKFRQPCPCGEGKDNTAINDDGSAKCFRCNKFFPNYEINEGVEIEETTTQAPRGLMVGEYDNIPERKLTKDTCEFFGVQVIHGNEGIKDHIYPLPNENGEIIAQKIRHCADKDFTIRGEFKETVLFGQNLFKAGSAKYITVTEGELDAMAAFQMTGSRWPCVSIRNGSSGAARDFKNSLEYLESFEHVVLCFDQDSAGSEAVEAVKRLITPGKLRIMSMPLKDASDMLIANKSAEYQQCFWDAEKYIPSGIINVTDYEEKFFEKLKARKERDFIPYPWDGLNRKLDGIILKSMITLTSGSGMGKSQMTRELEHHLLNVTDFPIGIMALEEDEEQTILGLMSIEADAQLFRKHVLEEYPEAKMAEHYEAVFKGPNANRVHIHSHLGIQTSEDIFAKLRFLMIGCGCKLVIFDHLHMLIASHTGSDERTIIDDIMLRLRSLVEETGCGIILVSHLRRTQNDRGHEQGIEVSLSHLRGSQSIAQMSDVVIAMERNQQAEDELEANTTTVRVLKSRHTGETGVACKLYYDKETGRMTELEDQLEFEDFGF